MSGTSPSLGAALTENDGSYVTIGGHDFSNRSVLGGAVTVLLVILPFVAGNFYTSLLAEALIFAIFAIGVDLLWGYTGIMTFGHAVFFGLGAYTMAKVLQAGTTVGPVETYLGVVASILIAGIVGLVAAGVLFYRGIQGGYFTIITLALAIIAERTAVSWDSVTGGFNGLTGIPVAKLGIPGLYTFELIGVPLYITTVVTVVALYLVSRRIVHSSFGAALIAINENETKARALGYNIEKYKTLVFGISCAMAGLSGALYTSFQGFVSPPLLGFLLSTEVLVWILIGGRGTLIGAVIGTIFLLVFESVLSGVFQFSWSLLLGIVLVLIVLRYPGGIVGVLSQFDIATRRTDHEVSSE
jgi:ABC-type branched-subunit amino acid transport system permease subunit